MARKLLPAIGFFAAMLLAGNGAMSAAITGDGKVDFTDHSVWGGANGTSSFSATLFDNVTVTLTAGGGNLTNNVGDTTGWIGGNCSAPTAAGLACNGDGIGIKDDEITGNASPAQILTVSLTNAATGGAFAASLTEIELLDLFALNSPDVGGEIAYYSINGGSFVSIFPEPTMGNPGTGYKFEDVGEIFNVTTIAFKGNTDPISDFALARLTFVVSPVGGPCPLGGCVVPEPNTLAIIAVGLAGIGFIRRRRSTPPPSP